MIFGLIQDIIDLEFLMASLSELSGSDIGKFSFQLMIYVEVGPNRTLKVVLLHARVVALDDLDHFCTIRVEFIVTLRHLWSLSRP